MQASVVGLRALGVLQNDPLRGPVALRTVEALVGVPADADGAGVATVVDGAALLSRVKLTEAGAHALSTAVGTPKGRATVVQIGTRGELRPTGLDQTLNLGPFRVRAYAAAVVGGPQDADEAAAHRERLLAGLPDFLRRCVFGKSEGEAFFLAVLARVHARGALDAAHENAAALLDAVRAVDGEGPRAPRQVTLTNGVDVLHVARGLPSAIMTINGLADDVASAIDAGLADSSTARERNRRYRAVMTLGALDRPLKASTPVPRGCALQVLPDEAAAVVGRDLSLRVS